MTYPGHLLVQFGGDLVGSEIWSCSVRMRYREPVPDPFDSAREFAEEHVEDVAEDVAKYIATNGSGWSSMARLRYVKFNAINGQGKYVDQTRTNVVYFDTTPYPASTFQPRFPPQVAMKVTLRTQNARGPASRGGWYIPSPGVPLDGNSGKIGAPYPQQAAEVAAQFVRDLNNWPGVDGVNAPNVAVVSNVGNPGPALLVNRVNVGDRFDVIQRRANALVETYVGQDV